MDLDATHKYLVTANQDKRLNVWSASSTKSVRTYRLRNSGEPYKVQLDPAGIFVATSSSDKLLRVYDFFSGECLAKAGGHSEQITRLRFTQDCRRLISVSADGCIFVHKLSSALTKPMLQRMAELQQPERPRTPFVPDIPAVAAGLTATVPEQSKEPQLSARSRNDSVPAEVAEVIKSHQSDDPDDCSVILSDGEDETSFQFRDSLLPPWARGAKPAEGAGAEASRPQGKWVSDGAVEPKALPGTLPAQAQAWAGADGESGTPIVGDDVVCTSDIESDDSEDCVLATPAIEEDRSLFRVSLKGDELPKIDFDEEENARQRLQSTQGRSVDLVRASMEQLAKEADAGPAVEPSLSPYKSSKNPLRQSLTSAHLQQMIAEVDAQVEAQIVKDVKKDDKPVPSPVKKDEGMSRSELGQSVGYSTQGVSPLSDVPVSGPVGEGFVKSLSASTLATEREALKHRKRLESLNRSFAESHNLKSSIVEASSTVGDTSTVNEEIPETLVVTANTSAEQPTESTEVGTASTAAVDDRPEQAPTPEPTLPASEDAPTVVLEPPVEPKPTSDEPTDVSPIGVLRSALDTALTTFKSTDADGSQVLRTQYREELLAMSRDITAALGEPSVEPNASSGLMEAVGNASASQVEVTSLLDKYSDALVTMVQDKIAQQNRNAS
eukprot:TRINITY_DN5281_c0_g1_i5.p1 TRINITY_DN5281_c0_g1~~TRINITY_DN5281_c0_g1_i5.p1  ORF type:complete len:667 (-),score=143.97 TRINITY_DN5281_c0_g1_i5:182-2182(-)